MDRKLEFDYLNKEIVTFLELSDQVSLFLCHDGKEDKISFLTIMFLDLILTCWNQSYNAFLIQIFLFWGRKNKAHCLLVVPNNN